MRLTAFVSFTNSLFTAFHIIASQVFQNSRMALVTCSVLKATRHLIVLFCCEKTLKTLAGYNLYSFIVLRLTIADRAREVGQKRTTQQHSSSAQQQLSGEEALFSL